MDLQNALQQTSEDRINELAAEEYPWLKALKQQLTGMEVPTEQAKFIQAIEQTIWTKEAPVPLITYSASALSKSDSTKELTSLKFICTALI